MAEHIKLEHPELYSYRCEQTHIGTRKHLADIFSINKVDERWDYPPRTLWYPYVASYYQYGEDYDAESRLDQLNYDVYDEEYPGTDGCPFDESLDGYTDRKAFLKKLNVRPACFLVVGKPGVGCERLGRLLGEHWKCVVIEPEGLVKDEVESGSSAGECIEYNLRCGRAISIDVVMRLLEKRLSTESIKHRGFVLSGFPMVCNKLFEEDPVSSEAAIFRVHEIFEEVLDHVIDEVVKNVSRASVAGTEEGTDEDVDAEVQVPDLNMPDLGEVPDEICYQSFTHADQVNQMEFVRSLVKGFNLIIVYVKCSNDELVHIRSNNRVDAASLLKMNLLRDHADEDHAYFEMAVGENDFDKRKTLWCQNEHPVHILEQLEKYRYEAQTVVEKMIVTHNPELFVKLDGRLPPHRSFQALRTRLRVLPIMQASIPELFKSTDASEEELGEEPPTEAIKQFDMKHPETWYQELRDKKTLGKLFKWSLSDWKYLCPVAVSNGASTLGDPNYAVHFLNKIYFLENEEAYGKFRRNPRPYLSPPYPLQPSKVLILGPSKSGRSTVALFLQRFLGGIVVNPEVTTKKHKDEVKAGYLEKKKSEGLVKAVSTLKQQRREYYEDLERARLEMVDEFISSVSGLIDAVIENKSSNLDVDTTKLKEYGIQVDDIERLRGNSDAILEFLPKELRPLDVFEYELVSKEHDYVKSELQLIEQCADAEVDATLDDDLMLNILRGQLKDIGGVWVMDGAPAHAELLEKICDEFGADVAYVLYDESPGCKYLKKRAAIATPVVNVADFIIERNLTDECGAVVEPVDDGCSDETYENCGEAITDVLKRKNVRVHKICVNNQTPHDLLSQVYFSATSMQCAKATAYTAEDMEKDLQDFGEAPDEEAAGEDIEDAAANERSFQENRRMGLTSTYCPVAYHNFNILWRGKEHFAAKFEDNLYFMSSEAAQRDFLDNAYSILHAFKNAAPKSVPPPRVCVIGTRRIGKTTIAEELSRQLGLCFNSYDDMLSNHLTPELFKDYLTDGNALPDTVQRRVLRPLWFDEPCSTVGFVLDGFPRRVSDFAFMVRNGTIPDLIVELVCDYATLQQRLLDSLLKEWEVQLETDRAKEQVLFEKQLLEWQNLREIRRMLLTSEKRDERYKSKKQETDDAESVVSYHSVEEEQDLEQINAVLDEELPEPKQLYNWETREMATNRIIAAMEEGHQSELQHIANLKALAAAELVPWETIDASSSQAATVNAVCNKAKPLSLRTTSIFERCYDLTLEMSEKLLELGYYLLSRFGKTCPVQFYEDKIHVQLFLAQEAKFQIFPVIHKRYIYFLAGAENRQKFVKDVLKYLLQKGCYLSMIPVRLALLGASKVGKSEVAGRMQYEYGLRHLSVGDAVRYVQKNLPESLLAGMVEKILRKGETLPSDIVVKCFEAATYEGRCLALGYVSDGFPSTPQDVQGLSALNLVPHLIVALYTTAEVIFDNMDLRDAAEEPRRTEYSKKFIKQRYSSWCDAFGVFSLQIQKVFQNVETVDCGEGRWKVWTGVSELCMAVVSEVKYYYAHKDEDRAFYVGHLMVTPREFVHRQSLFKIYCPLCLHYDSLMTSGTYNPDRTGLIQYQDKFYWLCDAHREEFIASPSRFLGANVRHSLPLSIPVRSAYIPKEGTEYLSGNCVVCMKDLKSLVSGYPLYSTEFEDNYYMFDSYVCLMTFLVKATRYCTVKMVFRESDLPSLAPPTLPILGYLEQYVAKAVVAAITTIANKRPILPGLDIKQSAAVYTGLCLKVSNTNTLEHQQLFKNALENTTNLAEMCIERLAKLKEFISGYVCYSEILREPKFSGYVSPPSSSFSLSKSSSTTMYRLYDQMNVTPASFSCQYSSNSSVDTAVEFVMDSLLDKVADI